MTTDTRYQEVTVVDVIERHEVNGQPAHVVVLLDELTHRFLPIWISRQEGDSIVLRLLGRHTFRPLTYDFMASLLEVAGAALEEVRIEALKDNIFYAVAKLRVGDTTREVDARPSDAINLALRMGSRLYAAQEVLRQAAVDIPEGLWEARQLGHGLDAMQQEWARKREEREGRRKEGEPRPCPTEEDKEKQRQELLELVLGVKA